MSFVIEHRLNRDFLVLIDNRLAKKKRVDYDEAVILGRGLAELIQAEHGDYWGNNLIEWRGRMIEVYLASVEMLRELVNKARGEVSSHIVGHLRYIEEKLTEL